MLSKGKAFVFGNSEHFDRILNHPAVGGNLPALVKAMMSTDSEAPICAMSESVANEVAERLGELSKTDPAAREAYESLLNACSPNKPVCGEMEQAFKNGQNRER